MELVYLFVKMRVEKGNFIITSHELEIDGRRFVEKNLGKTVNSSTVSRKWRLLKREVQQFQPRIIEQDPDLYVTVVTKKRSIREGKWRIIDLSGTPAEKVEDAYRTQLRLF